MTLPDSKNKVGVIMKRILLISVILAAMLLSACGTPATMPQQGDTLPVTTANPTPKPSATFTITSFRQTYYDLAKEWAEVKIIFKTHNTGEAHISYYEVYFTIRCDDGSQYQAFDNGSDIFIGQEKLDCTMARVEGKKVTSVEIDDFELTAGRVPDEVPSATFTITSFHQTQYSTSELSKYVDIYFDVKNNGTVYLRSYTVYFTVTCDDGSKYQDFTNGGDVLVGQKWSDYTITDVAITDVESKKVVSVEITNWELSAGTPPYIIYEITGTADEVDVTLNNTTGGTEQYTNVSVPVKYIYYSFSDWFLYISAQNQGESESVTVSIYVDGELFKTSSSSGAYVIATASGSR